MTMNALRYWVVAAVGLSTSAIAAYPPAQILVTRESQDLYRASAGGEFYIKTVNCYENVYSDRAILRLNAITKGGYLSFRNGKACTVDKFFQQVEPSKLNLQKSPF